MTQPDLPSPVGSATTGAEPTAVIWTDTVPYTHAAVQRLHCDFGDLLVGFVKRRLRGHLDSEDVVNDVWRGLIGRWQKKGALHQPQALLFKTAQWRCTSWYGAATRAAVLVDWSDTRDREDLELAARVIWTSTSMFTNESNAAIDVQRALADPDFPARQRQALLTRYAYLYSGDVQATLEAGAALMTLEVHQYRRLINKALDYLSRSPLLAAYQPTDLASGGAKP